MRAMQVGLSRAHEYCQVYLLAFCEAFATLPKARSVLKPRSGRRKTTSVQEKALWLLPVTKRQADKQTARDAARLK